MLEFPT